MDDHTAANDRTPASEQASDQASDRDPTPMPSPDSGLAPGVDLALGDLPAELQRTRALLAVFPEGRLDWRPHERSWTLGELGAHIAQILTWGVAIVARPDLDLASVPDRADPVASRGALLARWDEFAASLTGALRRLQDPGLHETWTLHREGEVVMSGPRARMARTMVANHLVHHRGQLGVYLRLLDVPLPPVYGPTADTDAAAAPG